MRFRLIASYLGAPYQAALGPHGDEITLFAACPPPEELGFSSAAAHWRKIVPLADLDGLRQARPIASYQGAPCLVLDDQGDRLHITYLGGDPDQARELGYWEIDREVFEMVVPRTAVADLAEEHVDIPLASAAFTQALTEPTADRFTEPSADRFTEPSSADPFAERFADPFTQPSAGPFADPFAEPFTDSRPQPVPLAAPVTELSSASEFAPVPERAPELDHVNGHQVLYQMTAWHGSPEPWQWPANGNGHHPPQRTARGGTDRVSIQAVFAELLDLAGIPTSMYAVDDEVPGAMCLMKTDDGFEVFASSVQARHEVRFFDDEEAAYFYLFGVLAAEAVRGGMLGPTPTAGENVSKYLRPSNLPN